MRRQPRSPKNFSDFHYCVRMTALSVWIALALVMTGPGSVVPTAAQDFGNDRPGPRGAQAQADEAEPESATVLRWRWVPGDVLRYRDTISQSIENPMMGGEMRQTQTVVTRFVVASVENEVATLRTTYESMQMQTQTPFGPGLEWDSTDDPNGEKAADPIIGALALMIDKPFTIVVDELGRVRSVDGIREIFEAVQKHLEQSDNPLAAVLVGQLESMFGPEAMRAQYQTFFGVVPPRPVRPFDRWSLVADLPNPLGTLRNTLRYEFVDTETVNGERAAVITMQGDLKLRPLGEADDAGPSALFDIDLRDVEQSGEIRFAIANGRVWSRTIRTQFTLTMQLRGHDFELQQTVRGSAASEWLAPETPEDEPETPERGPLPDDSFEDF